MPAHTKTKKQKKQQKKNKKKTNKPHTLQAPSPNLTTSMVGLKNGHIRKKLTHNGEPLTPRDIAGKAEEED